MSPSYLSQMASGIRPIPFELQVQIEELTEGEVARWHMSPDRWHRLWPELVGRPGAPRVPRTPRPSKVAA